MAPTVGAFRWQDGERTIVFGRGRLAEAGSLLGSGYTLLSTPRAVRAAPDVAQAAGSLHDVEPGRVDEVAGSLRSQVHGELLVALGGGRVIDVAKALAAADPPRRVAAIPTTLSGAEMTAVHRHAEGVHAETTRTRPAIVLNDPALSASQPLGALAQSAANALGHAAEGPLTPLRNPVATLAALHSARLIAGALEPGVLDADRRDALALAALLGGYVIGSTGYGLHHVLAQTLARFTAVGHGAANAIMLPHSLAALQGRFPAPLADLGDALGADPSTFAARLSTLAGTTRLREAGVSERELHELAHEASRRPELQLTPPAADEQELGELYVAAY